MIVTRRQFVVSAAVSAASLVTRRAESRRDFRNVSHFGFIEASDGTRQYVLGNVHGDSEPCSEGVYREYLEWFLKP